MGACTYGYDQQSMRKTFIKRETERTENERTNNERKTPPFITNHTFITDRPSYDPVIPPDYHIHCLFG